MRFISCASYYGTGSSAITDYVSEFETVYSFTDEEFRFIQDPDGISDLEYNTVEVFNRHNSGHALKRFKRLVDFYNGNIFGKKYYDFFGDNWKKYSYEYIDNLTLFSYKGWWQYDLYDKGNFYYFRKRILNKILHKTIWKKKPEKYLNTMKNEVTYATQPTEEEFLKYTREYIEKLFTSVVSKDKDIIMVDQLVPPTNLKRYLRYFNKEMKVVVVDRDPRDVFLLEKYIWKSGVIPTDVETFCKWYKYTRNHRNFEKMESENVKLIYFEDLVYNYNDVSKELNAWLKLDEKNHKNKFEKFDPKKSKKNTRMWEKIGHEDEIKYIEKNLSEYLYKY